MKKIQTIILILISLTVKAQDKEAFVNEVFRTFVDSSFSYYYLDSSARAIAQGDFITFVKKHTTKSINQKIIAALLDKSIVDTAETFWDFKSLNYANSRSYDVIEFQKKYYSNKRKQEKVNKKRWEFAIKKHCQEPLQGKTIYKVSRPIFSNENALIEVSTHGICICGGSSFYLFKKTGGKWILEEKFLNIVF